MVNYMISQIDIAIREIYELFGNTITIECIDTRNILILGLIVYCKVIIEIIGDSKLNVDLNQTEIKSMVATKERLEDLIDRCETIIEKKNIKNTIKLMTKTVISKPSEKYIIKPSIDILFIDRFIELITNYNWILHVNDNFRNILLFIRKSYLHLGCAMIDTKLLGGELNIQNCYSQKRNLSHQKELLEKSSNFIDIVLKRGAIKNVSSSLYKLIK